MRRDLLRFEQRLACRQSDVGLVSGFPFDPGVIPGSRVFQRPTPLPPPQREWVRKEVEKLEATGVLRRVPTCECACGVVLVEQGQQGQDYRMCVNFVEINAHVKERKYPI